LVPKKSFDFRIIIKDYFEEGSKKSFKKVKAAIFTIAAFVKLNAILNSEYQLMELI